MRHNLPDLHEYAIRVGGHSFAFVARFIPIASGSRAGGGTSDLTSGRAADVSTLDHGCRNAAD